MAVETQASERDEYRAAMEAHFDAVDPAEHDDQTTFLAEVAANLIASLDRPRPGPADRYEAMLRVSAYPMYHYTAETAKTGSWYALDAFHDAFDDLMLRQQQYLEIGFDGFGAGRSDRPVPPTLESAPHD